MNNRYRGELTPKTIKMNMALYGCPYSPDYVTWKGVTAETFGLSLNKEKFVEEELYTKRCTLEELEHDKYIRKIIGPLTIENQWKKAKQVKRVYSLETLKKAIQDEIDSRTS